MAPASAFRFALSALLLAFLLLAPTARAYDDGVTDYVTIPAGSYIVDMGAASQTVANGLKPYGLVYDLVVNYTTPVEWAINPAKAKDGTDFTYNSKNYKGGPFIIRAEYVTTTVSNIIRNWKNLGVLVDGPIASSIASVPVYDTIMGLAKMALDTDNGSIAASYIANAGIPSSSYSYKLPSALTGCDDLFVLPHADPTWSTHGNLLNFTAAGGYLWSACHAVSVLEAIDDPGDAGTAPNLNFLSVTGLVNYGSHDDGSPPYTYLASGDADPVMQFIGTLDAGTQSGSEQIYLPLAAGWRATTRAYVYDATQADVPGKSPGPAAVVAIGRAFGNSSYGRVMYEGGHDHDGTSAAYVAAQRAFLNFYMLSGIDRRTEPVPSVPTTMTEGVATNIGGTVSGGSGSYTYQWSSSIGGTFGNSNSLNTTFTPPNVATNTPAIITLLAADSCGRKAFRSTAVTVQFIPTSDLSVTCADSQDPVAANGSFDYLLSVVNAGADPATNVVVRNTLPAGAAYTSASGSGWSCSHSAGVVTCTRATLSTNVGSPSTITLSVTATNIATTLTNTVSVTSTNFDNNTANNTNTCVTTVINGIDLKLTKTAATNGYTGVTLPYTLTVTNLTPAAVSNVVITDFLPATLDYSSASGSGWSAYYSSSDRQVTLVLASLGSNAASTVTLNLVPGTNAAGLTVTNTASVASSMPDPDTSNNSATNTTAIVAAADLEISKSGEFDDGATPDAFIFYIELVNNGAATATSITVTDKLTYSTSPFPLYYSNAVASVGSFTSAGIRGSNGGTWTLTSLAPGASATLTLYYGGSSSATFTNTVQIFPFDQADPNTNNNAATTLLDKDFTQIDLAVLKTDSPDPVRTGSNITYTITATNTGTAKGDDWKGSGKTLTVTDTLPPNTTYVSASGTDWSCSYDGGLRTVTCTYTKDINHKAARSFTLVVTAPATPGTITNTANLSYTHPTATDPNAANDSYSQTTTVSADVDLRVLKSVDNSTPSLNSNVTFTVTVSNLRSNTATNVRITEALPAGLAYVSDSATAGLYDPGDGYWYLGSLDPGASATLSLVAQVTGSGTLTNTATLSALTQTDTNAANDSASASVTARYADLALGKSANTTTPSVNSNVTFTITLTNLGPSTASNITVSDVLPEYLQYVSHSAGQGSYSSATGVWSAGNLASNATATLTLTAAVLNWGWLTNTAQITSSTPGDPVSANNTASVGVEGQLVDLDPGKTVDNSRPLGLGSNLVFTIVVTNLGPSTATSVELTDLLPTGLGYVSHSASQGSYTSGTGKWAVGTLASNAYASLTLTATNNQLGKFTNSVAITACAQTITNTLDDTPFVVIYSGGEADLYLTKTVDHPTPHQGDLVTFTVKLDNYGPDPATGVTVQDTLPSGLTFLEAVSPGTSYSTNTGVWTVGTLASGTSLELKIKAFATGTGQIINTASNKTSNASDPDPIGNVASAAVNIITVNSVSGRVFKDIGGGGGTANNGTLDGSEAGLPGATLRLTDNSGATTYATATSDGGGYYVLTVPPTLTNTVTLKVVEVNPVGHLSTGAQLGNTGGSYDRASDTLTFTFVPGTTYTNVNFGDVPPNTFQADSQQAGLPNTFVVHPHLFMAGSAGVVTFSVTNTPTPAVSNWSAVVHHDLNGNSVLDPGEPVITSLSVAAGEHLHVLVKDYIPPYAPLNAQNRLTVVASFLYTNASPGLTNAVTLTDLTTVGTPFQVGLNLLKSVDKETALPGEVLTYTITYANKSGDVLRDVILHDQTPAYTVFHSATNGTLPLNLTNCVITAPAVGASGALRWTFGGTLAPAGTGTVTYKVTVAQ